MSNRKATMNEVHTETAANAQENFNAIYTAHQVHTIANLIYRQLSGGWNAQTPWSQPDLGTGAPQQQFVHPGWGMAPGVHGMPMHNAPAGFAGTPGPLAPPALFYWYP